MVQAKRSFVKHRDWFIGINHLSYAFVCHHPSVSLNKEKVCREISEDKIAVCEKTQGLRSGNFLDLNSACSTVLVPVKIFQFQDMHYENRFLGTFQGHSKLKFAFTNCPAEDFDFLFCGLYYGLD